MYFYLTGERKNYKQDVPAEVQAAGPADEPVVYSSIFQGFLVLPPNQMSSYAREPVTSFPSKTAPASFNLHEFTNIHYMNFLRFSRKSFIYIANSNLL